MEVKMLSGRSRESSEDIEKIFYQDSYGKKKIGSNVHRRAGKGGEKAGVAGGVLFAKNNFKKYEKNSKVQEGNVYETVLLFNDFKKMHKELQHELLYEWLLRYSKAEVSKQMNLSEHKLNQLIEELNVKRGENIVLTQEQMEKAKEKVIPYGKYKNLDDRQKYELLKHYTEEMGLTARRLSQEWNGEISQASLSSRKSQIKQKLIKQGILDSKGEFIEQAEIEIEQPKQPIRSEHSSLFGFGDDTVETEDEPEEDVVVEIQEEKEKKIEQPPQTKPITRTSYDNKMEQDEFNVNVNGTYTGQQLAMKVQSLVSLLSYDKEYQVSINVSKKANGKELDKDQLLAALRDIEDKINRG
jgi:hypothetical protein